MGRAPVLPFAASSPTIACRSVTPAITRRNQIIPRAVRICVDRKDNEYDRGVERDLVHPVVDLERRARNALTHHGIDLDDHDVRSRAAIDQGPDRRIAHVATVPVRVAVDLHRLVEMRQTS